METKSHQPNQNPQWLMLVRQRGEIASKVQKELASMSAISYPHGEASLASKEAIFSNRHFDFVEDELLNIIFCCKDDYML